MAAKRPSLSAAELARPFAGDLAQRFPPTLSPKQLAELLGKSVKTVYG